MAREFSWVFISFWRLLCHVKLTLNKFVCFSLAHLSLSVSFLDLARNPMKVKENFFLLSIFLPVYLLIYLNMSCKSTQPWCEMYIVLQVCLPTRWQWTSPRLSCKCTTSPPPPHNTSVLHTVPRVLWSVILGVTEHKGESSPFYLKKSGNVPSTEQVKIELSLKGRRDLAHAHTLKGRRKWTETKVQVKNPKRKKQFGRHQEFSGYANHQKTTWYLLCYALSFRKGLTHQVYTTVAMILVILFAVHAWGSWNICTVHAQHCAGYRVIQRNRYCCLVAKCVWFFAIPQTVACQALLPMGFPRQEYWSQAFPPPKPAGPAALWQAAQSGFC